jgi:fatty-acyl-CoA synthase
MTHTETIYDTNLDQVAANYQALSPLTFLERSAAVFPYHEAIIHGETRRSWGDTYSRCRRLASALAQRGISQGDTVAVMGANTPELYECHFGVPAAGAVLNALNVRLDARTIAFILDHSEAKVLITDTEFSETIKQALIESESDPIVIDIVDALSDRVGECLGEIDYEDFIQSGNPEFTWQLPDDEWQAICLNYTSGTTGNPKGVVYHHRGAYLNAFGNVLAWQMPRHPIYLWTLPMFHCNGWCFPWTLAALAGTNVCLRKVAAADIYASITDHGVTHLCGAPIIMNHIVNAEEHERNAFSHNVSMMTAGAAPPAALLEAMQSDGFDVTHVYGLTETYGPAVACDWHSAWDELDAKEQAALKARQGVRYPVLQDLTVMDPETMTEVPADGETLGEVMFKGNIVMKGYLKNRSATEEALENGWFHSGDLGVLHKDGYIQLKDRSKDIIISGGENISSIEVEDAIFNHPAVMNAAVVAKLDEKWGEIPCAFVELKPKYSNVTSDEIISFCRENLAHYKCPRLVVFGDLPKTSTGKIQKFILREKAKSI